MPILVYSWELNLRSKRKTPQPGKEKSWKEIVEVAENAGEVCRHASAMRLVVQEGGQQQADK